MCRSRMSNKNNYVAIDTNIFEHLLDPKQNTCNHIEQLLMRLADCYQLRLLVDCGGRIRNEYGNRLDRRMEKPNQSDTGNARYILEYWLYRSERFVLKVHFNDELMQAIKEVIPHSKQKTIDRIFVYVAFRKGTPLITNDRQDIIDEGNQKGKRRQKLLTIKCCAGGSDILTSEEAFKKYDCQ